MLGQDANKVYFTKKGGLRLLMELADKNAVNVIRECACRAIWGFGASGKLIFRTDWINPYTSDETTETRMRILISVGALEFALSLLKEDNDYLQCCGVNILWYCPNLSHLYSHLPTSYRTNQGLS